MFFHLSSIFALAAATVGITVASERSDQVVDKFEKRLGFGIQHLQQRQHGHMSVSAAACDNVQELRFTQAVQDNFAPIEEQVDWVAPGQRYWVNEELWGGVGFPIFVFIGGEWQESCSTLTPSGGYMYELAQEHSGLLLNVEHRFYGDSFPFVDTSTASLEFLSSQQALADLARLLAHVKKSYNTEHSRVITVGGSYSGNLAAWFSVKYPAMTDGSIASSGPIVAEANFTQYMDVVADSLEFFEGIECVNSMQAAAEAVAVLASEGVGSAGYAQLDTDFVTCSPMSSAQDLSILLSDLMGNVQGTVQYNKARPGSFNITTVCDVMLDITPEQSSYDQFVTLAGMYRSYYGMACEDASWAHSVAYLSATQNDGSNSGRPWTYQTCNEFGYYQTTDSTAQPFSSWTWLDMQFYQDLCFAAFDGWMSLPQDDWMNSVYGGMDIDATNVIFPSGSIDPWHALGVTEETASMAQESEIPLFIVGTSHCADLPTPAPYDPPSLTEARASIATAVDGWLSTEQAPADISGGGDDDDDSFFSSNPIVVGVLGAVVGAASVLLVGGLYMWHKRKEESDDLNKSLI